MNCQRCRAPLELHGSLKNFDPASFHLLADGPPLPRGHNGPSRQPYPTDRKARFDEASRSSTTPIFTKQSLMHDQHDDSPSKSCTTNPSRSTMSFHDITSSQVVPHAEAEKLNKRSGRKRSVKQVSRQARDDQSNEDEDHSMFQKAETARRLFEILSSRSDIDHPVCMECTDTLIEQMERRLVAAEKQRDSYIDFLQNARADMPTPQEAEQAATDLADARKEEAAALASLKELEKRKAALEQEAAELEREEEELDAEEARFWQERNDFTIKLTKLQDENDSVKMRYENDMKLLDRLQRTDVYSDTFRISHDGSFGTINGLRLGRLPNETVEWTEVNAAWGMALLLLDTLADKLGFSVRGYKLHPLGSMSSVERLPESTNSSPSASRSKSPSGTTESVSVSSDSAKQQKTKAERLPLYRGEQVPIVSNFLQRHFDSGMIAFLECLRQLGKHIEKIASSQVNQVKMPFDIKRDKINGCSIKLGGYAHDENWTKACKYTLTYCKFIMAHTRDMNPIPEPND